MSSCLAESLALAQGERWFLAHTLPHNELRAQLHLGAQGFRSFLPRHLRTIRHARRLNTLRRPLFPRYLFVALNLERGGWSPIRSTIGVSSLVSRDGRPTPVPVGIVEALIAQTDESNVTRLDVNLVEGQAVRILRGPFANFVGVLERLDDRGRVRVLLGLMGGTVPVMVERSVLSSAA